MAKGLDKLQKLLDTAAEEHERTFAGRGEPEMTEEEGDAALEADTDALLTLAASKTGGDIASMQVLVENAAEVIRERIRDMLAGDEGDEDDDD
jgi:predicted acetyltransferase